jgi:hypothetical protein
VVNFQPICYTMHTHTHTCPTGQASTEVCTTPSILHLNQLTTYILNKEDKKNYLGPNDSSRRLGPSPPAAVPLLLSHPALSPPSLSSCCPVISSSRRPVVSSSRHPVVSSSHHPIVSSSHRPVISSSCRLIVPSSHRPVVPSSHRPVVSSSCRPVILRCRCCHTPFPSLLVRRRCPLPCSW